MDNEYRETVAKATTFDRAAIELHFRNLHHAAARANVGGGKMVLAAYGQNPDNTEEKVASVQHFEVGDVEGMTTAALAFEGMPHHNVYSPPVILKSDTKPGNRREIDIAAVFALVVDGDADKGRDAPTSPLPADYVIESSAGNLQHFLFLDRPLPPDEAKPLAQALKRATGADGADDISHVWRVPGCVNWPNASKVRRGRPRDPQPVRVVKPWDKWTNVDALRTILAPHWQEPEREPLASRSEYDVCPVKARAFHGRLRDAGYYDAGPDARRHYIHAAKALAYDLGDEGRKIWEEIVCWRGARGEDEGAPVDANEAEARWKDCSSLKPGAKPVTHGTLVDDARKLYGWKYEQLNLRRDRTAADMFGNVVPKIASPSILPPCRVSLPSSGDVPMLAEPFPDLIKSSAEFVADFVPPDYLVDGILRRRYFYSLTAATGVGKQP